MIWGAVAVLLLLSGFYLLSSVSEVGGELLYTDRFIGMYAGDVYYIGAIAVATVLVLLRVVLNPTDRLAWLLIGLGACAWIGGELAYANQVASEEPFTYPSLSDYLYLLQYPFTLAGIIVLVRARTERFGLSRWLDGAIAATASAALAVALLGPALSDLESKRMAATLVNVAYPAADLLLLAVIFGAIGMVGRALDGGLLMLLGAFTAIAIADGAYLYLDEVGSYYDVHPIDTLWLIGAALLAAAAWMRPEPLRHRLGPAPVLGLPLGLAAAAIAFLGLTGESAHNDAALYLAAAAMLLVVARLVLALAENDRLLVASKVEAETDALTGLPNRRRLMTDLELATARLGRDPGGGGLLIAIYDLDGFKAYNDSFGHAAGDGLLRRSGQKLARAIGRDGTPYRLGGDEFCVLASAVDPDLDGALLERGREALREQGQGFTIECSLGSAHVPIDASSPSGALQLADQRMYAAKGQRFRLDGQQARNLLIQVLHEREPELRTHLQRVRALVRELARAAGLQGEELELTVRCAELHDIGKMAIPDEIVNRPGPLSEEEWELMKRHTVIGERILSVAPALAKVAKLVRSTHERWDGDGYPDGLAGEAIPLGARITFVCDAYDSILDERPYSPARSEAYAIRELREGAGTQFDPELVALFCDVVLPSWKGEHADPVDGPMLASEPGAAEGSVDGDHGPAGGSPGEAGAGASA